MKTSKQKRFAAAFAGMLCISCLTTPFSAAAEDTDITGENDTIAAAEEMPLNTAVSGEISTKGDVDDYKITLPEDGTLQISLTAGWVSDFGDSYCITLYDADGTEISKDDYTHSNTPFPADGRTVGIPYEKGDVDQDHTIGINDAFLALSAYATVSAGGNASWDNLQ